MSYLELKSGTDVRGFASDKGGNPVNLTEKAVFDITNAFIFWFCKKNGTVANELKISVGHDSRITADIIKAQVIKAITSSGSTAIDCGLSSTPAMFMTTIDLKVDAAIQITASHHPFDRNGLKFFVKEGGLDSKDISEL
jgi:phosphomannomutase